MMIKLLFLLTLNIFAQTTLEKVIIQGKNTVISKDNIIKLAALEDDILLEFNDSQLANKTYLYQLKQQEDDTLWTESNYPTAHFQKLKGGKYTFTIKEKNGKNSTQLIIEKETAFWNKWWFWPSIGLYVLLLVGAGIYVFFLYNFRQKLKLQTVRNQIAADLHDEVGSNLNSIAIFVELLKEKAPKNILPDLERIIENSTESISLMRDTVWMINPLNDTIEKLLERMQSYASEILATKDIALNFNSENILEKASFTMEQRKNCYLIFKEAISNIIKHAQATKVEVHVKQIDGVLEVKIADNGKGFNLNVKFEGNGLQNFKERAKEAEFDIKINSIIDKGTIINMKFLTN
jgi:signal transduction histidine kinase